MASPSEDSRGGVLRVLTYARVVVSVVALVLILVPFVQHPFGPVRTGHIAVTVFAGLLLISSIALGVYRISLDRRGAARSHER